MRRVPRLLLAFGLVASVASCRRIPAKGPDASPQPAAEPAAPADPASEDECAAQQRAAEQEYVRGRDLLDAARDGEHYRGPQLQEALDVLEHAAAHGSIRAHSLFGRRQFEILFLDQAPQPQEQALYVRAFVSLIIAARHGDPDARDYMPGLSELRLEDGELAPRPLPEPLDQIPRAWLIEAVRAADAWSSCGPTIEWV